MTRTVCKAIVLAAACSTVLGWPITLAAQTVTAPSVNVSPSPAPSTRPARAEATGDSCGGPGRLLATLNRPTVGYSPCAVPVGSIVLEEGYQNQSQGGPSPNITTTYPQGFERFGLAPGIEFDLIGPNANRVRTPAAVATGYNDLGLGAKYEFQQAGRFTYALDALFTAPTGTSPFGGAGPSQTANVDIAYSASPAIGVGTTLAAVSSAGFTTVQHAARYGYFLPSFVITAQIPNYYQFYAELAAQTKDGPDQGGRLYTDFGVQKLLGPFLELDLEYADSFTPVERSRFHYVGAGFGLRVR